MPAVGPAYPRTYTIGNLSMRPSLLRSVTDGRADRLPQAGKRAGHQACSCSELPGVQCRLELPGRVRPPVAVLRGANMLLQCLDGLGADLAVLGHIQVLLECRDGPGAERAVHDKLRPVLVQRPLHGGAGGWVELSVDRERGGGRRRRGW